MLAFSRIAALLACHSTCGLCQLILVSPRAAITWFAAASKSAGTTQIEYSF